MPIKTPHKKIEIEMPGLKTILTRNRKGELVPERGTLSFTIKMKEAEIDLLSDPEFNIYHAKRLFQWMLSRLPNGIYEGVFTLMKEEEKILSMTKEDFGMIEMAHREKMRILRETVKNAEKGFIYENEKAP